MKNLPSPNDLRNKYIICSKKITSDDPAVESEEIVDDDEGAGVKVCEHTWAVVVGASSS